MAEYTIELRTLIESPGFELFNFNYDFYMDDEERRKEFEKKFIDHYYFDEIGFETVARFKHNLRSKLNLDMPYYRKLYETELASQGITFLLNKDLREEFIRTVDNEYENSGNNKGSSTGKTNGNTTSTSKNSATNKESRLDNGVADVNLNNLTGMSGSDEALATTGSESLINSNEMNTSSNDKGNNKTEEKTVLISKGNIGTTSSAELLQRWRDVLIDIDKMIIEDCKNLFMLVY